MSEWFSKKKEPAPAQVPVKPSPSAPVPESTCPAPGIFGAVDLSQYCTQQFLNTMKYLGIKTIIRYYDWPGSPTLKQKIPTKAELELIKKNGFRFLGVFQHNNSKIASFTTERGRHDAGVALKLAAEWGQPKGSAIYFGVDFDPSQEELNKAVMPYALKFSREVRAAGYKVGAYGSGLTLRNLHMSNMIDLCWLSMSTGFRESKTFALAKKWQLQQVKDRNCGGINVDFNYVNGDIGDWELP